MAADVTVDVHTVLETSDRIQASGIQMYGWRTCAKVCTWCQGLPLGSRLAFSTCAVAEAWAICLPVWIPGFSGVGKGLGKI